MRNIPWNFSIVAVAIFALVATIIYQVAGHGDDAETAALRPGHHRRPIPDGSPGQLLIERSLRDEAVVSREPLTGSPDGAGTTAAGEHLNIDGTSEPADGMGILLADHLEILNRAHGRFLSMLGAKKTSSQEAVMAHYGLAQHCVANILRVQGHAQYEPDQGRATHVYRASTTHWSFGSSGAKFSFEQGRFPAYDIARKGLAALHSEDDIGSLTPIEIESIEVLYQQAVRDLLHAIDQ